MPLLRHLVPEAVTVKMMTTPDLAGYVLETLLSQPASERSYWNRRNFCMEVAREYVEPRQAGDHEVGVACSAAWSWLEANSFICRHPEQDNEWFVATPTGIQVRDHQSLQSLVSGSLLPVSFLHPQLLVSARPLFLQSRFDTAVFEAFKALEVAIRTSSGLGHDLVGVQLASRAFHPEDGKLTDTNAEKGERVAMMNLMTGALGSCKNPASHRNVSLTPEDARDLIVLASHLLKIVDSRVPVAAA